MEKTEKKDYRKTLNLPKTTFSMKANLVNLEPKMLTFWQEIDIYQRLKKEHKDSKKFILHDGPPYANGLIHIGHALNKVLKDIVLKFKAMEGLNVPFTCGWDCHGLPVEHQLFKKIKASKHDVDVVDFRKQAKDFALKFVDSQREEFKRLAIFSDWDKPYLTLSPEYENGVLELLYDLTVNGYVYRGRKPVNWCANCETALAEAEVEYADKESPSIYVLFKVKDSKSKLEDDLSFLVWTTTPWTLISNVAVAVHPNLEYGIYEFNGSKILCAKELKNILEEKFNAKLKEIKTITGNELEGVVLNHPFIDRKAPVVLADYVSKEDGSGCVHIAPGHGEEDFAVGKKYNLDILMPVNDKGVFTEVGDKFSGLFISKANTAVIEALQKNNALVKEEKIVHSYPHCWRCKKPVIFRATYQWFLNVDYKNLRQRAISTANEVKWIPESGIERMKAMLTTRPDWCLSRQRLWGIPIPAVKCNCCEDIVLLPEIIKKVADIAKIEGTNSWFEKDIKEFLPKNFKCQKCSGKEFSKQYDILDVWFESGSSFRSVLENDPEYGVPADMYLEGSDQHRGWFQVSLIPSVALKDKSPFKTILTHGFVVDGQGKKMSKSQGNVIAPQKIIKQNGAEILRLWVASSDYSEDIKISDTIIKQLIDTYRKIRNTIRFILGNINDFVPSENTIEAKELLDIDRFMYYKTDKIVKEVIEDYNNANFHRVCQKIFNFCNLELSSFYLDILKDRLYTYAPNSKGRRSGQTVLYFILKNLLKMIAPILSFTAEEAFSCFHNWEGKKESIFLHDISEELIEGKEIDITAQEEKIDELRKKVFKKIENLREEGIIGSSLEVDIYLKFTQDKYDYFKELVDFLREVLIVSKVEIKLGDKEEIEVKKAQGTKCSRCWNFREDVGNDIDYPDICLRCVKAVKEVINEKG